MRVTCTCGCGQQVTYATKLSHLNGHGKTSLRAKVLQENESLKPSTRRQPVLLQDDQKKKRSHPSSNQTGNRKRLRADRLDVDLPAQAHADPIESLPTPVPNQGPESPIQTQRNCPLRLFPKRTQAQKNYPSHWNQMELRMVPLMPCRPHVG